MRVGRTEPTESLTAYPVVVVFDMQRSRIEARFLAGIPTTALWSSHGATLCTI